MQTLVGKIEARIVKRFILGTFLSCSPLYSLRQGLPGELINLASSLVKLAALFLPLDGWNFRLASSPEWLYISTRNLNSGVHAR